MKHAMLDVEALRLKQPWKAPLMQAAFVIFNSRGQTELGGEVYVKPESWPAWAEPEESTLNFWQEQDFYPDLLMRMKNGLMIEAALQYLFESLKGVDVFWFAGPTYDQVMLEAYFDHYGIQRPWAYNHTRDFRTIRKQYPEIYERELEDRKGVHNALEDCNFQVSVLNRISMTHNVDWK